MKPKEYWIEFREDCVHYVHESKSGAEKNNSANWDFENGAGKGSYIVHVREVLQENELLEAFKYGQILYSEKLIILTKALEKAKYILKQNAEEDYRGNRSSASERSFHALKEIEAIERNEK